MSRRRSRRREVQDFRLYFGINFKFRFKNLGLVGNIF